MEPTRDLLSAGTPEPAEVPSMRPLHALCSSALLFVLIITTAAFALWPIDYRMAQLWDVEPLPVRQIVSCSDGQGGSFVVAETGTGLDRRVKVQHISHSGELLWGPEGYMPEMLFGVLYEHGPLRACPDGNGGVYYASVGFRQDSLLVVTHVAEVGTYARSVFEYLDGTPTDFELVPSIDGEAILVWRHYASGGPELWAAQFDSILTTAWVETVIDPFEFPVVGPIWEDCIDAVSNGDGGVLIAAGRKSSGGSPCEVLFQRIDHDGTLLASTSGIHIDDIQSSISSVQIEPAETFGAYVVIQDAGTLEAHHVDGTGTLDWGSPTLLYNTAANIFIESDLCSDLDEGLYSLACDGDLHANHIDRGGNEVWGSGGLAINVTSGVESQPRIVSDGSSGAVLSWINQVPAHPDPVKHLAGMRLDFMGSTIWSNAELYSDAGHRDPALLQAVPDASRGVHLSWTNDRTDLASGWQDIWAMGVNENGEHPLPRLGYLAPAASEYGQPQGLLIVGDYMDADLSFRLVHESGLSVIPVNNPVLLDNWAMEGWIHPTQVLQGDYHAEVLDHDAVLGDLPYAYTIAPMMVCESEQDIYGPLNLADVSLGLDGRGDLHQAWTQINSGSSDIDILYRKRTSAGWSTAAVIDSNLGGYFTPRMAFTDDGRVHLAYGESPSSSETNIVYSVVEPDGLSYRVDTYSDGGFNLDPRIAIDSAGLAHIVYASGGGIDNGITQHLISDEGSFDGPHEILSSPGALQHRLDAHGDGLVLVYLQLLDYPVYRVAYRHFDGQSWTDEVVLEDGLWIGRIDLASDGQDRILFIWDRYAWQYGGNLMGTRVEVEGQLEDLKSLHLPEFYAGAWVASPGPESFYLMTLRESLPAPADSKILLRRGNGRTFGPPLLIHSGENPSQLGISAAPGSEHVVAYWEQTNSLQAWECSDLMATDTDPGAIPQRPTGRMSATPNPFNPRTQIRFGLESKNHLTLDVYDIRGRKVCRLAEGEFSAGSHVVAFNARDRTGNALASGVYLAVLQVDGRAPQETKVVLLK